MALRTAIVKWGRSVVGSVADLGLRRRRAERAEQRLSLAQDETGVGLFELDYVAQTAYVSPALCQILGLPVMDRSLPLAQWLASLNAGHVADSRRTLQEKVAKGELRYERELHVTLPDGRQHWLLSRIQLDLDAKGQLAAARGATLDITARKQLVTELEAAQSQLRQQLSDLSRLHELSNRLLAMPLLDAALQATLDAVAGFYGQPVGLLHLCDADGRSRRVAQCGLNADALQELERLEAMDGAADAAGLCGPVVATGRRVVVDDLADGAHEAHETPDTHDAHDAAFAVLRPLAHRLGLRALHSTPLIAGGTRGAGSGSGVDRSDGSPRVLGVLTVLVDKPGPPDERLQRLTDLCASQAAALIEREHALSQARDSQRRFEVALQSSPVAFTILAPVRDDSGQVVDFSWTYANPAAAALIDVPADGLVGKRIRDVLPHAWDEPGFFERYVRVSAGHGTAEFDTVTRRPGRSRWLHVILSPLGDSVVVWFADVTEEREQKRALHDADRRKDEFLATLAHELRNPLAPIRHAAAIVRGGAASPAQQQWSLAVIERQSQHMAALLDDLLDVSRITRGTLPLRRVRSALRPIVDAAVEIAQPLFGQRRHRLVLDLPEEPLWLDVDPLRIGQVLGNLLVNAAKFTEPGGEIVLSVRGEGELAVLAVADNGRGLRPDECERVFEMFTQLPLADEAALPGLGIGLALARKLVELHGGRLRAQSAGPGLGSTFTAHLPLAATGMTAAPDAPPVAMASAAVSPLHRHRILVADDNRDAADSLSLLLGLAGHEVQVAYDGAEALERFNAFKPQVALLDLGMPRYSGTEVASRVRQQMGGAPLILVAITGFGQERDRHSALQNGFDHHLTKPIHVDELLTLLDGLAADFPAAPAPAAGTSVAG